MGFDIWTKQKPGEGAKQAGKNEKMRKGPWEKKVGRMVEKKRRSREDHRTVG